MLTNWNDTSLQVIFPSLPNLSTLFQVETAATVNLNSQAALHLWKNAKKDTLLAQVMNQNTNLPYSLSRCVSMSWVEA